MTRHEEWSVSGEQTLTFEEPPVGELEVGIVSGAVNVVGTAGGVARVEVTGVQGPPLTVRRQDGRLTVGYDDLQWRGLKGWLDRKGWRRSAVVSVSVPAAGAVRVHLVGASAVITGISGRTDVRGVDGGVTLVGLTGHTKVDSVSGDLDAQGLGGTLRFNSVSGNLTVIDGSAAAVKADSVSGDMVVDLAPSELPPEVRLNTVSGEVALRLPQRLSAEVSAGTASGAVSSGFPELTVTGSWGAKQVSGTLGTGAGSVRCTTVSGAIALLRRPADPDDVPVAASRKDV